MGHDSLFHQHEAFLFALDGALMFLTCASFLFYHPGRILVDYKTEKRQSDVESAGYLMVPPTSGQKPDQTTTDDGSNYRQWR